MNLHGIVSSAIATVNPFVNITIQVSAGYTTSASGKRTPTYEAPIVKLAQVQPLQYQDIILADGLQIQGERKKIYINGRVDGLVRQEQKGGDLVTLPDGTIWKVAVIVEDWPDWTAALITRQNGA